MDNCTADEPSVATMLDSSTAGREQKTISGGQALWVSLKRLLKRQTTAFRLRQAFFYKFATVKTP
jgi:hypothetical protein